MPSGRPAAVSAGSADRMCAAICSSCGVRTIAAAADWKGSEHLCVELDMRVQLVKLCKHVQVCQHLQRHAVAYRSNASRCTDIRPG